MSAERAEKPADEPPQQHPEENQDAGDVVGKAEFWRNLSPLETLPPGRHTGRRWAGIADQYAAPVRRFATADTAKFRWRLGRVAPACIKPLKRARGFNFFLSNAHTLHTQPDGDGVCLAPPHAEQHEQKAAAPVFVMNIIASCCLMATVYHAG